MGLAGAPGATSTAQRGSWADRPPPVLSSSRAGISGPVYLGAAEDTPGALKPQRVTPKQGSGPTPTRGPLVYVRIPGETLLYKLIPAPLWDRVRKWIHNDEANNAFIPPTDFSQTLNSTISIGAATSPIPVPVNDYLSELLFRIWFGAASQRFEDLEHGGEAAKILTDSEIDKHLTPNRPRMTPWRQNRLTGASILPDSPTLSRYQEVIGDSTLEGSTLY